MEFIALHQNGLRATLVIKKVSNLLIEVIFADDKNLFLPH